MPNDLILSRRGFVTGLATTGALAALPLPALALTADAAKTLVDKTVGDINGIINAGGRALETPFGIVYSTNITPDPETGIGAWSYPAFERAMREGIHRDGRHLYPAFPYNHFARTTDADLQALYAYLMAQPAVRAANRETALSFPFNIRPLMAGWNALFHKQETFEANSARSEIWNRGAYLVESLGHCGPYTPKCTWRGAGRARLSCRWGRGRLGSTFAHLAVTGADPMDRGRTVHLSANRRFPLPWRRNGTDGAGRQGAVGGA